MEILYNFKRKSRFKKFEQQNLEIIVEKKRKEKSQTEEREKILKQLND